MRLFRKLHKRTKAIRGRGEPTQNAVATAKYLRSLETEYDYLEARLAELLEIRRRLYDAWAAMNQEQHSKVIVMADQAQQRLHRLGKRIASVR